MSDTEQRIERGLVAYREVMGSDARPPADAYQDATIGHLFGEIWTRPGLPRHTRSLLTIMAMVALNREEELKLHLRAAANNGVSREEIKEVLLQAAIYCGVPAANSAFRLAGEVFGEVDAAG